METITPEVMQKCTTPVSDDHDEKYGVPSLEELGKFLCCLDVEEGVEKEPTTESIIFKITT